MGYDQALKNIWPIRRSLPRAWSNWLRTSFGWGVIEALFRQDLQDLYEFFDSFPFISVNPR